MQSLLINNGKDNLGKFDARAYEGIFLRYPTSSKASRVINQRNLTIEESLHITFDESNPKSVEVEVIYYVGILEKMYLGYKDQGEEKN